MELSDVLDRLMKVSLDKQQEILSEALKATENYRWVPNPGPQTEAYFCKADELFYGGQAGGGKSDLLCGLSLNAHQKSLILRRTNTEAEGLNVRLTEILGGRAYYHGQRSIWEVDNAAINISGCQLEDDKQKFKGTPHDLIAFDEVSDFSQGQYEFIIGWNRSVDTKQRCRVVAAGNPPTTPEGLWVVSRWAAWLDPKHPDPAKPGDLRWYTTNTEGEEIEVDKDYPLSKSRTFIPAELSNNPDLARTNYAAVLNSLPKELRDAYRDGNFAASLRDGAFQCIPTEWVMQAIARWKPQAPFGVPMCAIGLDVGVSEDPTVAAPRHDGWFAPLHRIPGRETPTGAKHAGFVLSIRRDNAKIIVDMGGGYGGSCLEWLKENNIDVVGYLGSERSTSRTVDKQLTFRNKRSQAYWQFREALDPGQPGGSPIALPDDRLLISDLTAPTFKVGPNGIEVEPKDKVCIRLRRSTDSGDAVVMAWSGGNKLCHMQGGKWDAGRKKPPKMVLSSRMSNLNPRR